MYGFGRFIREELTHTFLRGRPKPKQRRRRFRWSRGELTVRGGVVRLELTAWSPGWFRVVGHPVEMEAKAAEIEKGLASVLWRRVPAVRIHDDKNDIVLTLAGEVPSSQLDAPGTG